MKMSFRRIVLVCVCAAACLVASWRSSPAAPPADAKGDAAETANPAQMPVVAIIPPIGRGDPSYATLSPAFTSMFGSILEQSGRVIVVDRTSIGKVFSEKDLAEFGLTDREALAKKGQLIGANHVISGYYDVRDDKVRLKINRVEIADWLHKVGARQEYVVAPMSGEFSSDQLLDVVEKMARHVLKKLPEAPPSPPSSADDPSLAKGRSVAVSSLSVCPRDEGIEFALLKYEQFPYEEQLPYLRAYLEDVFGIPIAINEKPRKPPKDAFDGIQGLIIKNNILDRDLIRGQMELKCVGVTGLMGFTILRTTKERLDLNLFTTERSLISTMGCAGRTPPTHAARTFIVGNMLRNLSYCVATRIRPYTVIRAMTPSCPAQACVVMECHSRDCEMVPCPVCRKELYEIRKDWAKGPPERDPIVAGPTEPALADGKQAAEVLLVPMDISAEDAHLDEVAQCLSASLGLRCRIHERIDRGDNVPAVPKSLAEISPELDGVDKRFAAVCVLTGERFCEKPWNEMFRGEPTVLSPRRWRVWVPGLNEPGPKTASPLVVLSVADKRDFNLPYCYRRLETFGVEKDGRKVTVQAPAYSKLLIGGLATAARKDRECWTLGCPTTVWETIGIPHRCSHYLCPECRKAVAAYYGSRRK